MKRMLPAVLAATVGLALAAAPAQAQDYRFDVGLFGGGSWYSTMLSEQHITGATDANIKYEPGWLVGGQATFWLRPRLGLRADLAYSERPLQDADDPFESGRNLAEDINLWGISGDLLFRFKQPNERWMGREFLPYLALGLGVQRTNPAANATVVQVSPELEAEDGLIFTVGTSSFMLADDNTLMGLVGLGGDLRLSPNFALRLEVNDRIYDPQIFRLTQDPATGTFGFADPANEDVGKVTHWVSGQLGLHFLTGLRRPQEVVAAPPPPRAPAPPAAPAPPRVDAVSICVVDPTAPGGLRTVDALYRHEQRDTVVVAAGDTVRFESRLPTDVRLAPSASWYVQGQPLAFEFRTAPSRVEYLTVGSSRVVPAGDLTFIGYQGGVPVYAAASDVANMREQWNELAAAEARRDLDDVLEQRRELRQAFDRLEVLYVPVQPHGCVFQALQRQEEVRKGGR